MKFGLHVAAMAMMMSLATIRDASAGFLGLSLEQHTIATTPSGQKRVLRLYGNFSMPGDRLVSWGGTKSTGTAQFATRVCSGTVGSIFYNPGLGGNLAPSQSLIDLAPQVQWDTFATIGVSIADQGSGPEGSPNATITAPGFPMFIVGNQWTSPANGTGVFVLPREPGLTQARADYAGDGDLELRVMMAQLSVNLDEGVHVQLGYVDWMADGSSSVTTTTENLTTDVAAAEGRCCFADGQCAFTTIAACQQSSGATWLGCEGCLECAAACGADIAPAGGNEVVNIDDLLAVINTWGTCPTGCDPDVTPFGGNGLVNIDDLLRVINEWGPCP
jgi:hypothetical protein